MKIEIAEVGYVGLSLTVLLAQKNEVIVLDIVEDKVKQINNKESPIKDEYIAKYLEEKKLKLKATLDYKVAFKVADYIIICTPTNYNENKNSIDTSSVEDIIKKIKKMNITATVVIKSTVPVGFIDKMRENMNWTICFFLQNF